MERQAAITAGTLGDPVPPEVALEFAGEQVRKLVTRHPGRTPVHTEGGRWHVSPDGWAPEWTGGFLAGLLCILARRSDDPWWLHQAKSYCRLIEPRKADGGTHDLGFLFWPAWQHRYLESGDPAAAAVVTEAGRTMAGRFQPQGRYLSTWVDPCSTFIDVMMNVNVIFHAASEAGDESLAEIALAHCMTTRRHLVRGDGSVAHEAWFDPETGEHLRSATHQGWRSDSSWARGQAWAIYGFATAYELSGDDRMLDTARRCADFYIGMTPAHGIPPNDWEEPDPERPFESSAAAAAAAGMLRLSELEPGAAARSYRAYAETIVTSLCTPTFLAIDTPGWEGILLHAVYHRDRKLGVDESVMWGDYYFVEALDRLLGGAR
jgi:unsaturated chondroitin disaccharide hydrolase